MRADRSASLTGKRVGNYSIGRLLAKGRAAHVYRARDLVLKRPVAMKISWPGSRAAGAEIIDEARAIASIDHPNVIAVYSAGWTSEAAYLVMELIDGETLDDMLERESYFSWRVAASCALEIANGLAAIHEVGIVHGDIKPRNVLVDGEGRAIIADLGIPRRWRRKGHYFGTPNYSSPEQCRFLKSISVGTDTYSLGVMIYEMLTGVLPFDAPSETDDEACTTQIFKNVLRAKRLPISSLVSGVPPALSRLVTRMMSYHPADRPTAANVARSLERLLSAPVADPPSRRARRVTRRPRRLLRQRLVA